MQVVQSLKFQASSRNYSELGSCPSLNTGQRPLLARSLGDSSNGAGGVHEEFVQTAKGRILVVRQGDPRKPVIITYHDLGLNYSTNFQVNLIPYNNMMIDFASKTIKDRVTIGYGSLRAV